MTDKPKNAVTLALSDDQADRIMAAAEDTSISAWVTRLHKREMDLDRAAHGAAPEDRHGKE